MKRRRNKEQGVALVTTVIVVAVLAVVAVAFMQSTTVDRLSSRSVANYARAKLAAEAGAASAEGLVTDLVRRYPDSATVWQNIGGGAVNATNNEATVLYVRAQSADTNLGARPAQFGGEVTILARPLISLQNDTALFPLSGIASALPPGGADMVNLNATNASQPRPFIGLRSSTNAGAPVAAAQWIYMGASPGPTNATNPAISRYAYWVEDESFKVNVNIVTNGPRGASSPGISAAEVRLDGAWGSAGTPSLNQANPGSVVSTRGGLPGSNFPTALTASIPAAVGDAEGADELKFLTTAHSAGLDLSRGGFKRFNINSLTNGIAGPTDAGNIRTNLNRLIAAITNSNSVPNFGQRFYRLRNDAAGINSTNAVSANHAAIYLNKIAANVLDYIDADDQPTVVNVPTNTNSVIFTNMSDFTLRTGRPTNGILPVGGGTRGTNPIAAMGVENVPRLQEYAVHLRIRSMRWDRTNADSFGFVFNTNVGAVNPTSADYEVWLDHYFEFWNPGTRDYTNSADTFLKIFDQPRWGPGVGGGTVTSDPPGRANGDFTTNNRSSSEIPLIDAIEGRPLVFRAGEVTVVTTAPFNFLNAGTNTAESLVVMANPLNIYSLNTPNADRVFRGKTTSKREADYDYDSDALYINGGPDFGYNRLFEVQMEYRNGSGGDYLSGVLIGNDQGIIESHVGLPIAAASTTPGQLPPKFSAIVESSWNRNDLSGIDGNIRNGNADNVRGGSLFGNTTRVLTKPSPREGDPRSLLEQLELDLYTSSGGDDQTRFYSTMGPGVSVGSGFFGSSTFGRPNANYVRPTNWVDYSSINPGSTDAPLYVRNGSMQSIGELGHITDPARPYITGGSVPLFARGGGRTLRVGQSELTNSGGTNVGWYDGNQTNASRTWTSWRLADIFTTTAASNSATAADASGNLTNSLGVVRGPTNANGAVVTIPGLINPNGVLRDGGAALRAVLHGMTYASAPEGVPGLAGVELNAFRLNGVVNSFRSKLTTGSTAGALNPFWERGEISELPIFNTGNIPTTMSNKFDRGREELVRRSIEMITTRGSIFTVYAIGQTLQGTNVTGVARMKQTFQIEPQFATADAFSDSFNPSQAVRVTRRFSAPTNYTVRVLSTSYD